VQGFDSYGGGEDRRFEVTGYSRLELAEDRWWTVDPTGGAFVTVGLNLADETNLKCPHSAAPVRLRGEQGTRVGIEVPRDEPYRDSTDLVKEFSKCVYETI
jgi:hypothetical protein